MKGRKHLKSKSTNHHLDFNPTCAEGQCMKTGTVSVAELMPLQQTSVSPPGSVFGSGRRTRWVETQPQTLQSSAFEKQSQGCSRCCLPEFFLAPSGEKEKRKVSKWTNIHFPLFFLSNLLARWSAAAPPRRGFSLRRRFVRERCVFRCSFTARLRAYSSPFWGPRRRCTPPSGAGPDWAERPAGCWCRPSVPASASSSSAVRRLCRRRRRSLRSECGCRWCQSVGRTCCGSARPDIHQTGQSSSLRTSLTLKDRRTGRESLIRLCCSTMDCKNNLCHVPFSISVICEQYSHCS